MAKDAPATASAKHLRIAVDANRPSGDYHDLHDESDQPRLQIVGKNAVDDPQRGARENGRRDHQAVCRRCFDLIFNFGWRRAIVRSLSWRSACAHA
jgi:hypothetical protein